MTKNEIRTALAEAGLDGIDFGQDNDGQLVIYTGLVYNISNNAQLRELDSEDCAE